MKTPYWIMIAVVTFLAGLLIGYGIWGSKVADLKAKVEQLTEEKEQMKAGGTAASTQVNTQAGAKATPTTPPAALGPWPGK